MLNCVSGVGWPKFVLHPGNANRRNPTGLILIWSSAIKFPSLEISQSIKCRSISIHQAALLSWIIDHIYAALCCPFTYVVHRAIHSRASCCPFAYACPCMFSACRGGKQTPIVDLDCFVFWPNWSTASNVQQLLFWSVLRMHQSGVGDGPHVYWLWTELLTGSVTEIRRSRTISSTGVTPWSVTTS